jgi:pimeloyl-ACP methyl ester carboxylesterase
MGAAVETRTVTRDGSTIEYKIDGKGPPVLLIASLGRPASDFDALAATLATSGYTAIRPEPRGIGRSSGPLTGLTLRDLAADALASVPAEAGGVVVVGHAFGQRVARMMATTYPDRVKAVVMLASGGKVQPEPAPARPLRDVFETDLSPAAHLEAVRLAFFAPGHDPAV